MPFYRLITPTYFGGLPATHDAVGINNLSGPGTPAPVSLPPVNPDPYEGTRFEVPGESAEATRVNRSNSALAANCDFIDDILHTSRPVFAFEDFTAPGGGDAKHVITAAVFVGRSGVSPINQDERDFLVAVVSDTTMRPLLVAGVPVTVSAIFDSGDSANVIGTEATGYHTNPIVYFSVTIPAAVTYRLVYYRRGTVAAESNPADATGDMGYTCGLVLKALTGGGSAATIGYAGGPAWYDSSPNPATTAEAQFDKIISDLILTTTSLSGAHKIGSAALTAWRGGRARALGSVNDQLQAVGVDLSAQTAADDGAERIGAEAHTAAGAGIIDLALGSVRSQLNELSDAAAAHALDQLVAGSWAFSGQLNAVTDGGIAIGVGSSDPTRYLRRFSRVHTSWSCLAESWNGGDALADFPMWTGTGTAAPTVQVDALDGKLDLATTAATNATSVIHTSSANYDATRGLVMEAVVQLVETTLVKFQLGFTSATGSNDFAAAATDSVYVRFDTGPGDAVFILCGNAAGSVTTANATTAPSGATQVRLTIVVATDGSAELFVNGVSEASIAASSVGTSLGNMYAKLRHETLTTAVRTCELDDIKAWQEPGI